MSWLRSKVIFHSSSNSHFLDCRSTEAAIKHYQIKKNDSGQWYVTERHVFQSVPELIWYHQHNAAGKWGTSNWVSQGARPLMGHASLVSGTQQEQISLQKQFKRLKYNLSFEQLFLIDASSFFQLIGGKRQVNFLYFYQVRKMIDDREANSHQSLCICSGNLHRTKCNKISNTLNNDASFPLPQ